MKTNNLILIAVLGIAGYFVYKYLTSGETPYFGTGGGGGIIEQQQIVPSPIQLPSDTRIQSAIGISPGLNVKRPASVQPVFDTFYRFTQIKKPHDLRVQSAMGWSPGIEKQRPKSKQKVFDVFYRFTQIKHKKPLVIPKSNPKQRGILIPLWR